MYRGIIDFIDRDRKTAAACNRLSFFRRRSHQLPVGIALRPCDQHVLLDHVYVHAAAEQREACVYPRGPSGSGWRLRGEEVPLVLPVGAVHAVLPRRALLHAALDVEAVGGG